MLSVVTFKWAAEGYRSKFTAEHVNTMRRMVARHYPHPHRFICVTDDPAGLDRDIEAVPLWGDHARVPNPTWPAGPSCYRRLRVFDTHSLGERFVCIDLDAVIVGDLTPLWHRPEQCVTWLVGRQLCGAMFLQTARSRPFVWTLFDPVDSPRETTRLGYRGSDQAWMTACLQHCSGKWTQADGLYEYHQLYRPPQQRTVRQQPARARTNLPADARIVFFCGKPDPWDCSEQWVIDARA